MSFLLRGGALVGAALLASAPAFADGVPEPPGYRMDAYRAPVPETLEGARVLDDASAHALWREGDTLFLDVMPRPQKPDNLPEGTLWIGKSRDSIPGSIWVPNVGYGRIDPAQDAYFRRILATLTGGDRGHPIVIFCQRDCWMSWNAARRAITEYGYTRVFWYPEGSDGWAAAGHPLARIEVAE